MTDTPKYHEGGVLPVGTKPFQNTWGEPKRLLTPEQAGALRAALEHMRRRYEGPAASDTTMG